MDLLLGGTYGMILLLVSLVIGLVASIISYLEFKHSIGSPLCRPGSKVDCIRVHSLPQAWILGFHLAQISPVYFTLLLVLALASIVLGSTLALKTLAFITLECSLLIPYMIYLMIAYARAVCLYCLTMHASILITSILTYRAILV
ncbi:MAG: vitamin K epoxide reductase family protein [Acidilobaceae archaeon]